jgi:hypothetical protein
MPQRVTAIFWAAAASVQQGGRGAGWYVARLNRAASRSARGSQPNDRPDPTAAKTSARTANPTTAASCLSGTAVSDTAGGIGTLGWFPDHRGRRPGRRCADPAVQAQGGLGARRPHPGGGHPRRQHAVAVCAGQVALVVSGGPVLVPAQSRRSERANHVRCGRGAARREVLHVIELDVAPEAIKSRAEVTLVWGAVRGRFRPRELRAPTFGLCARLLRQRSPIPDDAGDRVRPSLWIIRTRGAAMSEQGHGACCASVRVATVRSQSALRCRSRHCRAPALRTWWGSMAGCSGWEVTTPMPTKGTAKDPSGRSGSTRSASRPTPCPITSSRSSSLPPDMSPRPSATARRSSSRAFSRTTSRRPGRWSGRNGGGRCPAPAGGAPRAGVRRSTAGQIIRSSMFPGKTPLPTADGRACA